MKGRDRIRLHGLDLRHMISDSRIYIEKTARLLYPPVCPLCRRILTQSEGLVHSECLASAETVCEPRCKRCGKPILSDSAQYCRDCFITIQKFEQHMADERESRDRRFYGFDQNAALWLYEGIIRQAILDYKYNGMKAYTDFFVSRLAGSYGWWIRSKQPELLIPVPIHPRKKRIRGYNQAGLLADGLSKLTGIPARHDLLVRTKFTDPQKTLAPEKRRQNLEKVMQVQRRPMEILPQRVMIIDDIYTTGSTLDACAAVLKRAGVKEVYGLTLCIGDTDRGK